MKRSDSLDLDIRGFRTRRNELTAQDTLTDAETTECDELEGKVKAKETQFRAAKLSEDAEARAAEESDGESRELAQLTERANVGDILSATFEKRQTIRRSRRASKALRHRLAIKIPLEMLRVDRSVESNRGQRPRSRRASETLRKRQVITPVFRFSGDGAFLGIERPTVPTGDAAYPVLSTVPSVKGPFTDSDRTRPRPTPRLSQTTCRPKGCRRVSATGAPTRPASLASMLRYGWRLNGGLQEKLDQQAIEGTDGLLTATNLPNANVSTQTTFQLYLSGLSVRPR